VADNLCPRGVKLFEAACWADHVFKSSLVHVFSNVKKDEKELQELEVLGARQRDADEAFHRHKRFCTICSEVQQAAARHTAIR
jgi:hypothetical protein